MPDSINRDDSQAFAERIQQAFETDTPLALHGAGSKHFLGETGTAEHSLDVTAHRGIIRYEPGELILTARAGTRLADIQATLAEAGQCLAFEPPAFGDNATLGGTIATNLSGPARPFSGAARDFVLGARLINGRGEILHFGGEVMKNVAGYDLSRLMAGAFGTLGLLLDISLKVLPQPRTVVTQVFEQDQASAIQQFSTWGRRPWPITGAYWENGRTYLRLAGATSAVTAARDALGGDTLDEQAMFWADVREQRRDCLAGDRPLWRLSLPPATPDLETDDVAAIDWGGSLRWLQSDQDPTQLRDWVSRLGGHASLYRGSTPSRLQPLSAPLATVHTRLKESLDPAGILNPGRMYPQF